MEIFAFKVVVGNKIPNAVPKKEFGRWTIQYVPYQPIKTKVQTNTLQYYIHKNQGPNEHSTLYSLQYYIHKNQGPNEHSTVLYS